MKKVWIFYENMGLIFSMVHPIIPFTITDPLTQSNCYIFSEGSNGLVLDPNYFKTIDQYLSQYHILPVYVVLTHEHCDHISALNDLRRKYNCTVISSEACSKGIQNKTLNMTRIMETYLYFKSKGTLQVSYPPFTCNPSDITFTSSYTFYWQGHKIHGISVPGHTPGSTVWIVDDNILFSGDYFIPDEDVITRLPGGDDVIYHLEGIPKLCALPTPIQTFPGHKHSFLLTEEVKKKYGL